MHTHAQHLPAASPTDTQLLTSPAFTYKYITVADLTTRNSVAFTVRTDYDAAILLTDDSVTSDPWEIVIGGWPEHGGMSAIR